MSAESKVLLAALALTALAVVVGIWLFARRRSSEPVEAPAEALSPGAALPEQTALLRAVETLGSELDPERVLPQLVEQLAELLRADTADYYVYEPNRRTLRCVAVHGLPGELVGFEVDVAATLAARTVNRKTSISG
jgi:ABC-type amino acid transport substrate-binding protein